MSKILLVIDEDIACIKDSNLPINSIHLNGFGAINQAKQDAKEFIKQAKLELIDEILKYRFGWSGAENYATGVVTMKNILAIKSEIEKE